MNTLQQSILKIWPVTGKCQIRHIMLLALMVVASYVQVNAQSDPSKPVVYATSITGTGMNISWDPSVSTSSSIESYQLIVTENGSTTPKETINSATSPHTLTGLNQNTAYLITVKAVDATGSYALSTISKTTLDPAYNGVDCPVPGQVPGNNSSSYGARIIGNGVGQEFSSAPWDNNPDTYVAINTAAQPRPTPILQHSWVSSNVFADRLFISIRNGNYPTKIRIKGEDPAMTLLIDLFSIDNPQFTSDGQFLAEWVIPQNTDLGRYSIYFTDYTFPNDPIEINSLTFFHSQCRNSVNPPAGYNEPIPPVDITVPPAKPIVSVIKTEQTLIDISWTTTTPLAEIESYQLTATSTFGTEVTNIPSDQSTYRLENLEAGTAYEIKLTVKGNNGLFSDEEIINETTLASPVATPPTDPVLTVTNTTDTNVSLSWTASTASSGIKYYHMKVTNPTTGAELTSLNNMAYNVRSFTLNAYPNATFRFILAAEDSIGNFSNEVTVDGTTLATPVATLPTDPVLTVTNTTDTEITVDWTASTSDSGIKSYQLTVVESATETVFNTYNNIAPGTLTKLIPGLTANTAYDIKLKAEDNDGLFSNEVTIAGTTISNNPDGGSGENGGVETCLSAEEKELYLLINEYRAAYGLLPIALSPKLSKVAQLHAKDVDQNAPCGGDLHSWSDQGSWTACCDSDGLACMHNKPAEIAGYSANGYEISAWTSGTMTGAGALNTWQNPPAGYEPWHRDVILNQATAAGGSDWSDNTWSAIGIGIYGGVAQVWFGELADGEVFTSAEAITCDDPDPTPPKAVVNFYTENITCNSGQIRINFSNDTNLANYQVMVADNAAMTGAQQITLTGSFDVYHTVDGLNPGTEANTHIQVKNLDTNEIEKESAISFTTLTEGCGSTGGDTGGGDPDTGGDVTCPYPGETFDGYSGTFSRFLQGDGSGPVGAPDVWDQNPETYVHVDWVMDFWVMWHYYSRNVYANRALITISNGAYPKKIEIKGTRLDAEGYTLGDVGVLLYSVDNPQFSSEGQFVAEWEIPANTELNRYRIKFSNGTTTGENITLNTINFWHAPCDTPPAEYDGDGPSTCVTVAQPTGLDVTTAAVVGDGTEYYLKWAYDATELSKVGSFEIALSGPASFNETYTVDASNVNRETNSGLLSLKLNNYWTNPADGNYTVTVTAVSPDNCSRVSSDAFAFDVTDPSDGKYLVIRPAQCTSQKINWGLGNNINPAEYTVNITLNSEAPIQVSDASSEHILVGLTSGTNYTVSINAVHNTTGEVIDLGSESFNTLTAGCDGGDTGGSDDANCLTAEEETLYLAINQYRADNGLAPIPLSPKLSKVAHLHAVDHENHPPTSADCNGHSWSANGTWTPCCYTDDHANASCIWDKPQEISGYNSSGYENFAWSSNDISGTQALEMWKNSPPHNSMILNTGIWASSNWQAMGVGIFEGTAYLWVGELADGEVFTTAEAITCDDGLGSTPPKDCELLKKPTNLDIQFNTPINIDTDYTAEWIYESNDISKVGSFKVELSSSSGVLLFSDTYTVGTDNLLWIADSKKFKAVLNYDWTSSPETEYNMTVIAISTDDCPDTQSDQELILINGSVIKHVGANTEECNSAKVWWSLGNEGSPADYKVIMELNPSVGDPKEFEASIGNTLLVGLSPGTIYRVNVKAINKTDPTDEIVLGSQSFETLEGCDDDHSCVDKLCDHITEDANGNVGLDLNGDVKALSFIGDGSQLTNIDANNIFNLPTLGGSLWEEEDGTTNIFYDKGIVSIGTKAWSELTPDVNRKLIVNGRADIVGNLAAMQIAVSPTPSLFDAWSDFVFAKDYDLRSLGEVEAFIKSNKHLPDVPSATEVAEKGLDLFKMDATLLQKVEELTLYLIEQNKKLSEQQLKLIEQQLKLIEQNKRIESLEAQINNQK